MDKFSEPNVPCCIVMCTFPSLDVASTVSKLLLSESLIACSTMIPGALSLYTWNGAIEQMSEIQCIFKTSPGRINELAKRISALHPYDVPEIIVVNVLTTTPYSSWIDSCLL